MSTTGTELPIYVQVIISICVLLVWSRKNFLSMPNQGILALVIAVTMMLTNFFIPSVLVLSTSKMSDYNFVFFKYINYTGFPDNTTS